MSEDMNAIRKMTRLAKRKEETEFRQTVTRQHRLWQKTTALTAAFTLLANPLSALAAVVSGDSITTVNKNGGVYEVETSRRYGQSNQNAVNVFSQFGLNANEIANLYFGTKSDNSASNLFNFVNARIDVNGTVNAIKNNKIGGNLYFLSKEGLFVGSTGVINTGSLYVMTPAGSAGVDLKNEPYSYETLKGQFVGGAATEGTETYKRVVAANIPLNADATISVLGQINAINNIGLYAPKIAVGKDITNGTAATVKDARLKTGVVDFKDLVNTNGSSGLPEAALIVSRDADSGDIVLAAKAEYANTKDQIFNNLGSVLGLPNIDLPKTITASVGNYGKIEAARDAKLTAEATNGNRDLAVELVEQNLTAGAVLPSYVPISAADAGNFAQTVAKVDIQGAVTSGNDTIIKAEANNTYVDQGKGMNPIGKLMGVVTGTLDANVMILGSEASVNIGSSASITAANNVDITAYSKLDGTLGLSVKGSPLVNLATAIPTAGVAYTKTDNKATVTVAGAVTSQGTAGGKSGDKHVNIAATAEELVSTTGSVTVKKAITGADPSALVTSVAVTDSSNHALVEINKTVEAQQGDVKITADALNTVVTTSAAKAPDDSMASAAINVLSHNSSAQVNINQTVKAGGNLTVDATNTILENTATANNSMGMSKFKAEIMKAANVSGITKAAKGLIPTAVTDKLSFLKSSDSEPSPLDNLFSAGAAVVVANESNTSGVKIAKTAGLQATGDLKIGANVLVQDTHMEANAKTSSYKDGSEKDAAIAAGVVYAGIDNSAAVEIESRDAKADEIKISGKNISIKSGTIMQYDRVTMILRDINRSIEQLNAAIDAIKNLDDVKSGQGKQLFDNLVALKTSLESCAKTYSTDLQNAVKDPGSITADGTMNKIFDTAGVALGVLSQVTQLQNDFNDLLDVTSPFTNTVNSALGVVTGALAFTEPGSYANFTAGARAAGSGTNLSAAGSVTITDINHTSRILIGRNVELAAAQKLEVGSQNTIADVNIIGKNKFWKSDAAGPGVSIGGSFNYQDFDTNSLVAVAEGAALSGGDVKISSDNKIFHVGAVLSAGKSDGSAISGMVSLTDGDSINAVSVDDGAAITAVKGAADNPATKDNTGAVTITATNNTSVNNAILSISAAGGSAGVGMGVAINNLNVQNIAAIADNSKKLAGGVDVGDLFGDTWSTASGSSGQLTAQSLTVAAETTGLINAISIAGGVTKSGESGNDNKEGFLDKVKAPFKKISTAKDNTIAGIKKVSDKLINSLNAMSGSSNGAQGGGAQVEEPKAGVPDFSLAGAGSVALNLVDNQTKAVVDGAKIELTGGGVQVGARDSAFIGAWSGAAAISQRKPDPSGSSGSTTSVALAGAVGVNNITGNTSALLANSVVNGASAIDVTAVSGGTQAAAGIAATVTKDSSGTTNSNYQGGASVSVNLVEHTVNADMNNVTVNDDAGKAPAGGSSVDVTAYNGDVQVTGGVNVNVALSGGQVAGGAVTVADIHNTLNAGIHGGTYKNIANAKVQSLLATTQVTAAVAAGVAAGGSEGTTNNVFGGAVVYNGIKNQASAVIDGADISATGPVSVLAHDTKASSTEAKKYQDMLGSYSEHQKYAADRGIDVTGNSYSENLDTSATKDDRKEDNKALDLNHNDKSGSTIVTAALTVAGSNGNAAGAAVNIGDIDNTFAASIKNAKVTAVQAGAAADADTLLVSVAGGVAAGTKTFGGMGSVSWQTLGNHITADIEKTKITADTVSAEARNSSLAVNVAGQVTVGKKAAVGATLAYNALDNTTGAHIKGSELTAKDATSGMGVTVKATGDSNIYSVGASVAASTDGAAINGTVVINRGGNNTDAAIDQYEDQAKKKTRTTITQAKTIDVQAEDKTGLMAVVANVAAGSKVAVGAGVAYNDIGGSSADTAAAKQNVTAHLDHTDITTVAANTISVTADDTSKLLTIAAGIGGSGKVAVQGAAATALINKNLSAAMSDTGIDKDEANAGRANVMVDADNQSDIYTGAVVVAVSGKAAIGAGVSVNRILQDTTALVDGGVQNVGDLLISSQAKPSILTIGVGGAGGGDVGVAGSVAVNKIVNNNRAKITGDAVITAQNNIGLLAGSDELISNYAGVLAIGGKAAVGATVSVNDIQGDTEAAIEGTGTGKTKITALGKAGSITTNSQIDDTAIVNQAITAAGFDPTDNLRSKRQTESKTGLVVDASATHNIRSALANLAGGGNAAAAATVNVNEISGSTTASVSKALLNGGTAGAAGGDVSVTAGDYTNSAGFVGTAAGAGNAAAGLSSDTNIINRSTAAKVANSDLKARDMAVKAISKQGISSFSAGVAVAGQGAGIAGTVGVTKLNARTTAELSGTNAAVNTLNVQSDHLGRVSLGTVAVGAAGEGAGIGLAVGVTDDSSVTEALVNNSNKTVTSANGIAVKANNTTELNPFISSFGVGVVGVGVAGSVSVNNINSQVKSSVTGGQMTAAKGNVDIDAGNTVHVDAKTGGMAAGAAGIGASVSVNTIDSQVSASSNNAALKATDGDIGIQAAEKRDISQFAVNGAAGAFGALSANIMVTNVGKALSVTGGDTAAKSGEKDASGQVDRANTVYGDKNMLASDFGAMGTSGSGVTNNDLAVNAGKGKDDGSLIKASVTGGLLKAGGDIAVKATETDRISMNSGNGTVGGLSVNASVGILNVKRNTAVELNNAQLDAAKKINIQTLIQNQGVGTVLNMYQGTAGIYGVSAGYARLATAGASSILVAGSSLQAGDDGITIEAKDQGSAAVNAYGLTAGAIAAGVIVTEASNDSSVAVTIDKSNFTAKQTAVTADKANNVTANAVGGAVGFAGAAVGVAATASDQGDSSVTVQNGATFSGDTVSLSAQNAPAVKANAGSAAVALSGAGGASVATAKATGTANLNILGDNQFKNKMVNFNASIATQTGKATAQADAVGLAAAGIVGLGFNLSHAESTMSTNVTVDEQTYQNDTNLTVSGYNATQQKAQTKGLTIGGILAAGSNMAETVSSGTTTVNVKGGAVNTLTVNAIGTADNTVLAGGSGGGLISGGAVVAQNTMKSDAAVNLSGTWKINGDLTANAAQNDIANLNADSVQAGFAAINGASAVNTIGNKETGTAVNVIDGTQLSAGTIGLTAKNNITVNDKYSFMVEGAGYGAIAGQAATADNTVDKKAAVNAGKTSKLTARTGGLTLAALTDGTINNKVQMKTGGLIAVVTAFNTNTVKVTDEVNLGAGARAETKTFGSDVTFAASDSLDVTASATASNEGGAAGGSAARMTNTLNRRNSVQVDGVIRSMNDTNLYAGTKADGAKGILKLDVAAEAYNKSVIPVAVPDLNNTNKQTNTVIISSDAKVDSTRHINLAANQGREYVEETSATYTWYEGENTGKSFTGTAAGKDSKSKISDNYVKIDGSLTAGTQNKLTITIDGVVAPAGGTITGDTPLKIKVSTGNTEYDQELKDKISTGTVDYGKELFARYQALSKLVAEYGGNYTKDGKIEDLDAYVGYKAEQTRVYNQMKELGLISTVTDGAITVEKVSESFQVNTIELPNLAASGGNIVVDADNMTGSGSLIAKGAPQINITNNSTYYMKLNDVQIGEPGGEVKFKNSSITANGNTAIRALNRDQTKEVSYNNVKADGPNGEAKIGINSTWNSKLNVTYTDKTDPANIETDTLQVKPLTTIEINGAVKNMYGAVNITNDGGDILIQGKTENDNASVQGRNIMLSAPNGSITQGYTDGIVNIGSSPEADWAQVYKNLKAKYQTADLTNPQHAVDTSASSGTAASGGKTWIAGDSVYINAADINVNGTIQSGYDKYQVTIEQAALDAAKQAGTNGSKAVVINGETLIKINDGNKSVYQADTGKYVFEVQAYYNPRTGKIVVDDVETKGGQVQLTGHISSTGNGKILALDGGAAIDINNKANADLQTGNILNNNIAGLIKITDLNTKTITEYTRTQTKVSDLFGNNSTTGGASSEYAVKDGLRYNWTEGATTETSETYQRDIKKGLWGAVETQDSTALAAYEKTTTPQTTVPGTKRDKSTGSFIGTVNGAGDSEYALIFDNVITKESRSPVETWKSSSGFLGWFKWTHYRWTVNTGSSQTYLNSVKADKKISIGFIGQTDGKIDITGKQNVELLGNVRNNTSAAILNITAGKNNASGAIMQGSGTVYGDKVNLEAATGINGIDITSLSDRVRLDAHTNTGNINISVDGGWANNRQFAGNIDLVRAISDGSGNVSLAARGDITQQGTGLTVQGNRIDLVSTGGQIGTGGQALVVRGGQSVSGGDSLAASINAAALGNINLTQDEGNMRIGTVDSAGGDVKLTVANGSFVDALPTGKTVNQDATDKKLQKWKDLGLINGDGAYSEKRAQQAVDYKAAVEADYRAYQEQKAYYDSSAGQKTGTAYEAYQALAARFDKFSSADAYLANDAKYQDLSKTLTDADYKWNQNQLLYALQDTMVNKEGGSTQTEIKAANISGNNITLTANKGGIGIDKGAVTITDFSDIANLKQLVNADANDVTWTKNASGQFQTATINGKSPLGIHTRNNGVLSGVARDNIYIAGRTEGLDTPLYIDKVTSGGNIRVLGKAGVFSVSSDPTSPNFTGKDLILEGGSADIGTVNNAIRTVLSGQLTARTDGSAYIRDISGNGLNLSSAYAGQTLWLRSSGNIISYFDSADPNNPMNKGRITAQNIDIVSDNGNVGTAEHGLRITNFASDDTAGQIRITGQNVYLEGISAAGASGGTLALTEVTALASDGVIAAASTDDIAIKGDLKAAKNITLQAGRKADSSVQGAGAIKQTAGKLTTDVLSLAAGSGIQLGSTGNTMNSLTAANDQNEINIYNAGTNGLNVTISKANAGSIVIENQTGTMAVNAALEATGADNDIILTNRNGAIDMGDATAARDVKLKTTTGNIGFADLTAGQNVDVQVLQQGNITGENVKAVNDTLTVHTVKGDIDLKRVYAGKTASVGADDGSIKMFSIDGENVVIQIKNKSKNLHVPNITAAKDIIISSNAIDINKLTQRPGYDNMLLFEPQAADSNSPMEYFNIGEISTRNGLEINQLWAKRAELHVDSKRLYIDKLSILDTGYFSNDNTTVTVYGSNPRLDGSANAYFWYNPNQHNPWMYLNFMRDEHILDSNGVLLRNNDYYYTYSQRFSGVEEMSDRMQRQMSRDNWLLRQYMNEPASIFGNYGRFGLLDFNSGRMPQIQPLTLQTAGEGQLKLF